jgi:hypothetical protein
VLEHVVLPIDIPFGTIMVSFTPGVERLFVIVGDVAELETRIPG